MAVESNYKDLASISKDLDKLAIVILETLQSIVSEKQYLEDNLKDGYINMAKARYLMRGQKISTLQINKTKLVPSIKVINSADFVEGVEYLSYQSMDTSVRKESGDNVRRRSEKMEDLSERVKNVSINSDSEDKTDNSESSKDCASPTDPLRWFGVLVPESLRICQSRFKQATNTALKIASLQNQLKALGSEYRQLKKQKNILVNTT